MRCRARHVAFRHDVPFRTVRGLRTARWRSAARGALGGLTAHGSALRGAPAQARAAGRGEGRRRDAAPRGLRRLHPMSRWDSSELRDPATTVDVRTQEAIEALAVCLYRKEKLDPSR